MEPRRSRTRSPDAREGYRGRLRKPASQPALYKDHHLSHTQLGFTLGHFAATPSKFSQICPLAPPEPSDLRSDAPRASTSPPPPPQQHSRAPGPRGAATTTAGPQPPPPGPAKPICARPPPPVSPPTG